MDEYGYSWRNTRQRSSFTLPKTEHFGRWVMIAVVLGVIFHAILYYALEKIPILVELISDKKEETEPGRIKMSSLPNVRPLPDVDPRDLDIPLEDPKTISEELAEIEDVMDEISLLQHF